MRTLTASDIAIAVAGISALLLTTALLWLAMRSHFQTRNDELRFKMFAVRDNLLRMVAEEEIPSESRLYRTLSFFVNEALGRSQNLGGWYLAQFVNEEIHLDEDDRREIDSLFRELSPETERKLRQLGARASALAIEMLRLNSRYVRIHELERRLRGPHGPKGTRPPTVDAVRKLRRYEETLGARAAA